MDMKSKYLENVPAKLKSSTSSTSTSTEDLRLFPCGLCESTLAHKTEQKDHMEINHVADVELKPLVTANHNPSSLDFPCNFCDQEFKEFNQLIIHIKNHHKSSKSVTEKNDFENNEIITV